MGFNPYRAQVNHKTIIQFHMRSPVTSIVKIAWSNVYSNYPLESLNITKSQPRYMRNKVRIEYYTTTYLTNRFYMTEDISQYPILCNQDDDLLATYSELFCMWKAARDNNRIVSQHGRFIGDNNEYKIKDKVNKTNVQRLILTTFMFTPTKFLKEFWRPEYYQLRRMTDMNKNGEDILLSLIVSKQFNIESIQALTNISRLEDFGGISKGNLKHENIRSVVLDTLMKKFNLKREHVKPNKKINCDY